MKSKTRYLVVLLLIGFMFANVFGYNPKFHNEDVNELSIEFFVKKGVFQKFDKIYITSSKIISRNVFWRKLFKENLSAFGTRLLSIFMLFFALFHFISTKDIRYLFCGARPRSSESRPPP